MRLPRPFYRLPARFDVERLRAEIAALPASAWAKHPNHIAGNSCVRLISVGGGENDDVDGVMQLTAHLAQLPYVRQVLASFGVVWSRSRVLRLAPGAQVPEHADINYHWFNRVRLHIPVVTRPEVCFYCGDQSVHMAAGEAWLFDNWRRHRVENPTSEERIHIVADTSGSASFWQFVAQSEIATGAVAELHYDAARNAAPLTERTVLAAVMVPAEVDLLTLDLRAELISSGDSDAARSRLARYHGVLDAMCRDWRQLYSLHGADRVGWPEFAQLRDRVRAASQTLGDGLTMRTNGVAAHAVLEGRVLRAMLCVPESATARPQPRRSRLKEPTFIIAAPRSGSTLLFETLARSEQLYTVGGEGHALIEGLTQLQPGAPRVSSNRLDASHATAEVAEHVLAQIQREMRSARGEPPLTAGDVRFLEKTPKNALRVPFLKQLFPDARFILLWRDPRENLSSIIEAWRSGQWKTYNGLDGFDGPWSLLLPPGWQAMNARPLEEIAAFQWDTANRLALADLAELPAGRWKAVSYAQLLADPAATIRGLCEFIDIEFDASLAEHTAGPLPASRFTLTAPQPGKWRQNEAAIERVLPSVTQTWDRLRSLR